MQILGRGCWKSSSLTKTQLEKEDGEQQQEALQKEAAAALQEQGAAPMRKQKALQKEAAEPMQEQEQQEMLQKKAAAPMREALQKGATDAGPGVGAAAHVAKSTPSPSTRAARWKASSGSWAADVTATMALSICARRPPPT